MKMIFKYVSSSLKASSDKPFNLVANSKISYTII